MRQAWQVMEGAKSEYRKIQGNSRRKSRNKLTLNERKSRNELTLKDCLPRQDTARQEGHNKTCKRHASVAWEERQKARLLDNQSTLRRGCWGVRAEICAFAFLPPQLCVSSLSAMPPHPDVPRRFAPRCVMTPGPTGSNTL
jgi:hypothetical protein